MGLQGQFFGDERWIMFYLTSVFPVLIALEPFRTLDFLRACPLWSIIIPLRGSSLGVRL